MRKRPAYFHVAASTAPSLNRVGVGLCAALLVFAGEVAAGGWMPLGAEAPSAAGLGMAYAGTAVRVEDASVVAANPAGLSALRMTGNQGRVAVGFQSETLRMEPQVAGVSTDNVRQPDGAPSVYLGQSLSSRWAAGLAVTRPYAWETRYGVSWPGGASRLRVESQRLNPVLAYRVNETLSLGGGVSYQTLSVEQHGAVGYQREGAGLGWNVGGLYELSPQMRLGLTYRSQIDHSLAGGLELGTPAHLTFSVWQQYSDRWEASGELSRYRLNGLQGSSATVQQAAFAHLAGWRFAWGAAYRHDDRLKSRFGIAVERNPADGSNLASRLGEDHAVWLAAGFRYQLAEKVDSGALDFGLAVRWPSRVEIQSVGAQGEYRVGGHVASVQYSQAY